MGLVSMSSAKFLPAEGVSSIYEIYIWPMIFLFRNWGRYETHPILISSLNGSLSYLKYLNEILGAGTSSQRVTYSDALCNMITRQKGAP